MDLGLIVAIVGSSLAIIASMISLFLWVRAEANADRRHFHDMYGMHQKEIHQLEKRLESLKRK